MSLRASIEGLDRVSQRMAKMGRRRKKKRLRHDPNPLCFLVIGLEFDLDTFGFSSRRSSQ